MGLQWLRFLPSSSPSDDGIHTSRRPPPPPEPLLVRGLSLSPGRVEEHGEASLLAMFGYFIWLFISVTFATMLRCVIHLGNRNYFMSC